MSTPLRHALASLAERQHGIVGLRALRALSLDGKAIARLVADGTLHRLHLGVYAVGHRKLTQQGRWLAAVLACGEGAALSHRAAAAALDLAPLVAGPIDVTAPGRRGRADPRIRPHRSRLDPRDVMTRDGIPMTKPARTLLDLAEIVSPAHLERAVDRALARGPHDEILSLVARSPGRKGHKRLRTALHTAAPDLDRTRSELEIRMRRLIETAGLPPPELNVEIAGYEVDMLWRDRGLVVELDGFAYHNGPQAFEADRRRTADLQSAGLDVRRFTWHQVTTDAEWVRKRLAQPTTRGVPDVE
jgi:very-short-patch-repair endonuclease